MKGNAMKSAATQQSQATSLQIDNAQFKVMDFFKILIAAVMCGIAFSLCAVTLTLLLTSNAEAGSVVVAKSSAAVTTANKVATKVTPSSEYTPGVLNIGDGCEQEPLSAIERDWQIRIDGDVAVVRIMQSYLIPADGPTVANFQAQLPEGAVLASLKIDAANASQTAKLMTHQAFAALSRTDMRALRKSNRLIVLKHNREIESDSILNLIPGETLTVEYTYAVPVQLLDGAARLNLVLQSEAALPYAVHESAHELTRETTTYKVAIQNTVWVEWVKNFPRTVSSKSGDISIEKSSEGITGASWFSADLSANRQFNITWDRMN